jgi:hypothetical protein
LFCFVLFCFVLFCFVLFCFVLFCLAGTARRDERERENATRGCLGSSFTVGSDCTKSPSWSDKAHGSVVRRTSSGWQARHGTARHGTARHVRAAWRRTVLAQLPPHASLLFPAHCLSHVPDVPNVP